MKRVVICSLVCLLFSASAATAQNPLKKMWPFGKSKPASRSVASERSMSGRNTGMPSPMKWLDQAEKSTGAVFKSARKSLKGIQDIGKSLNPFAGNTAGTKPQQKKSLLDTIFPKQPKDNTPLTMNDFMKLERPKY